MLCPLSYERSLTRRPDPVREVGVSEGIRTPDGQIHSLELYHLSYTHHAPPDEPPSWRAWRESNPRPTA